MISEKNFAVHPVITTGHAFVQNIRRGHDGLGVEEPTTLRVMAAFTELTMAI
ncbi:MAG: hypothetical protein ACRDRW_12260 [Pseudonocardiaceae bacterium]